MQSFVFGVFNKFHLMSKFYFKSCGRFCCASNSPNYGIKAENGVFRMLVFQRMFFSRQLQTHCKLKPLCTVKNTSISGGWMFYGLRSNIFAPRQRFQTDVVATRSSNHGFSRNFSSFRNSYQQKNKTTAIYTIALVTVVLGGSYAAVPLYRIFCQASGLGGTVQQTDAGEKIKNMTAKKERLVTVRFNADKSATLQWSFKPQQPEVKVYPGETALAFYTAKNPTDVPITGISTYNVIPFEAGQYFNKIQCFCFEEQRLNPHEQVDMPVFFYIDPEFLEDPALYKVDTITLSYTFFQAKEAQDLGIQ